jgi:hypothetical protein
MRFDENTVAAGRDRRAGEHRRQLSVAAGGSCGTAADRLRTDLEASTAPKCGITSTQLTTGSPGQTFKKLIGGPLGLQGPASYFFVHYVVKFSPCGGMKDNFSFDAYTHPSYGVLDPRAEVE